MSNLDGLNGRVYTKTLNGLDQLGDTNVSNLTVGGNLTVLGTTDLQGNLDMNFNYIVDLADGVNPQDAVTVNQLTTIGTGFLKTDGSNSMVANMDLGTNQINNVVDGTALQDAVTVNQLNSASFLKLDGTTTMTGNIDAGNQDLINTGNITSINGVTYNWTNSQALSAGDVLQNDTLGNLTWATPGLGGDPTVDPPIAGLISLVGSAYNNSGSSVVQPINVSSGVAGASASIDTVTADINIDGKYTTNNLITPQIHINPNLIGSSAQLKLGTTSLTTSSSIVGIGNLKIDADDDMTFNIAALGSTLKELKVQSNSIDVFSINNDGAITNSFGALTTLPNYFRQQYSWITKQNTQAAPLGSAQMIPVQPARSTQGGTNQYGVGLFTNDVDQYYALSPPPAYGGGTCVALQMPTKGIIRSCRCIAPYGANGGVVMNIRHQGGGQMSFANFQASPSLGTFNTGGGAMPINSNMDFTMSIGSGVLPGEFGAGTYLLIELEEIYASAGFPPAGDHPPGENWYNFVMVVDVEY